MRVLHINSTIYINSGVMTVIMNYYKHIDHSKINFDFLYFMAPGDGYKTHQETIESYGGKVYFIPDFTKFITFNRKLDELLKNNSYNIVHIHDPFVVKFIHHTLRKNHVKNIIVHSHATQWSDKRLNGIRNQIICLGLRRYIDYPFACSEAAGNFLYGKKKHFTVLNNAIDTERYAYDETERNNIRAELNVKGRTVYGHVGNFNNQKNHVFLIEIFKEILKIDHNAILMLIGDGPLRTVVVDMVKKLKLEEKVLFLGKKNDVQRYYQAMDCFILPSLYEGLPMVGVEAQCSGLPIIFSDTITKEVGIDTYKFLSLNNSPKAWAKVAVTYAHANKNRELSKEIVISKGFDVKKEASRLENLYLEMSV